MAKTPFDLQDKVAIVTGGGTGIGKAISQALAQSGAHVVICSRRMEHLEATARKIQGMGRQSLALPCDVRKEDDVKNIVEQTVEKFGKLDILVNNAGASFVCPIEDVTLNGWNAIFGINVTGVFLFSKAACQEMKKQNKGVIINISSIAGRDSSPMMTAYGAAKAAVINLTKALAVEFSQYNIRVNCIAPGLIITEAVQQQMGITPESTQERFVRVPLKRWGNPEEIAWPAVFLASEASSYMTGETICVDGGPRAFEG
ncbi:MAG: glucose 1-dehydrogenase [Candidatus Abyssobacteria bacterium SURF_17]|jgi:gluconate 5-dehydrogenase|uniref:Peroxisomal trans-2-enoyl-CoA reductase n=1 Tax=Candidatus Abyssobacteria bacterium SURF_17 TaxID=2093361 RepID=A0A419EYU4_9BACT|nr:MAG: glucose 1-dehydrogenase [Candidatus Abyssubacteria bacterium SURF_17]